MRGSAPRRGGPRQRITCAVPRLACCGVAAALTVRCVGLARGRRCDAEVVPVEAALRRAASYCASKLSREHVALLGRAGWSDVDEGEGFVHETSYFKRVQLLKWAQEDQTRGLG